MPLVFLMVSCTSYYSLLTLVPPACPCQVLFCLDTNFPVWHILGHLQFSPTVLSKYHLHIFVPLYAHTYLSLDHHDSSPQLSSYTYNIFHYYIILSSLSLYCTFRVLFINQRAHSMYSDQSDCLPTILCLASTQSDRPSLLCPLSTHFVTPSHYFCIPTKPFLYPLAFLNLIQKGRKLEQPHAPY